MKRIIVKLFMLISALILTGCSVDGTVKDEDGNAVSQAKVTAVYDGGTQIVQTDVSGHYNFTDVDNSGTVRVTVTKDGFIEQTQTAELSSSGISLNFTLVSDTIVPATSTVNGIITDTSGIALYGVTVESSIESVKTDAAGIYSIMTKLGERVSITASLENYAENSHNTVVIADEASRLDMSLATVDKTIIFDVTSSTTIETKGASIRFEGGSIVNLDGSVYTGDITVKVTYNQVTNTIGKKVFPGDYVGIDSNGNETLLISYGFMNVTIEDTNSNKLRLADGATSTLTFPIDSNIASAPSSIALWYYDTTEGIWKQDGSALYDINTKTYIANVSHFTTWSLNIPTGSATLNGCVEDVNGNSVSPVNLLINTSGYYGYEENQDANGNFIIENIPSNQNVSLTATSTELASKEIVLTFNENENKILSNCLVLEEIPLKEHSITGRLVGSDGQAIGNQDLNIQVDGITVEIVEVDNNGYFSSNQFLTDTNSVVTLMDNLIIGNENTYFEQVIVVNQNSDITDLGNLEVKTTTIVGCAQYSDGSTMFDYAIIAKDSISGEEYASIDSNDGTFSFVLPQNSKYYNFYAYSFGGGASVNFNLTANTSVIYFNNPCVTLQ